MEIKIDKIKELVNEIPTPKVKKYIELRYGINDGKIKTIEETAKEMKITLELAREFESRGLRIIKNRINQ